jgi:hypothetical protein
VRPTGEALWKPIRALVAVAATFVVCSLPLIVEAVRLIGSGRYVTQTYFWRSAPRGIDALSPLMGNPFHPILGGAVSRLYQSLGLDRIEAVGWLGLVPVIVLLGGRGVWSDPQEARRWKIVLGAFLVFALGPFLVVAGTSLGLPLPQTLARFIPLVDNARMPGRAMVGVYLALGVLVALRLAGLALSERPRSRATGLLASPAVQWILIVLLAFDFLSAPIPLTALDRPAIYERLAALDDGGPVIEVPFGIGDGLSGGAGSQERRVLYYATLHGHPLVGGFIGRMPPGVADAYRAMPVVGNLLRLSQGEPASGGPPPADVPFRYLVLDTRTASAALDAYVRSLPNLRLIASDEGRQLYGVQGATPGVRNQIR